MPKDVIKKWPVTIRGLAGERQMLELNKIYCENNLQTMARMPGEFADCVVTSPPYGSLRSYNGFEFDFESIAQELFRVTKQGGVVVWVVGDETINGSESGESFRQALYFKNIGFNLLDTMVYQFAGTGAKGSNYAYWQAFEYMFIFTKGTPRTVNRIADHKNIKFGAKGGHIGQFANGSRKERGIRIVPFYSVRPNVWKYGGSVGDKTEHTAQFPEQLAKDHILSWSNENDLIYDPFMGSGTVAKAAHLLKRNWIGSEISPEYVDLANRRLAPYLAQATLF